MAKPISNFSPTSIKFNRFKSFRDRNATLLGWIVWPLTLMLLAICSLSSFFMYRGERHSDLGLATDHGINNGLVLAGQMSSIDVYKREFILSWFYEGSGNYSVYYPVELDGYLNVDSAVYYNGRPEVAGNYIASHESNYVPQTFSTIHRTASAMTKLEGVSSVNYPFDTYSVNVSFAAVWHNKSSNTNNSLPIKDIRLSYPIQGWTFRQETVVAPYVLPNGDTEQGMVLLLTIKRSGVVRIFVLLLIILSWTISLVLLFITLRCKIFGKPFWPQLISVFASVLFALPALRNTMPAAPTFGTYSDVYGFLINEVIVGVCLVIMVVSGDPAAKSKKVDPPLLPVAVENKSPPITGSSATLTTLYEKGCGREEEHVRCKSSSESIDSVSIYSVDSRV